MTEQTSDSPDSSTLIGLFLCGDVMTGRGVDQILPHPGDPHIDEPAVSDATRYVELAEAANGPIQKPVAFPYIWGDALRKLEETAPDVRLINLETAVTTSDSPWPGKGIQYRMHPANVPAITAADIDCCTLANNHVLDFERAGLGETLDTLRDAGIKTVGAGRNIEEATTPAIIDVPDKGRVVIFGVGHLSSGIPLAWLAEEGKPGLNLLYDLSEETVHRIAEGVRRVKRDGDIVVVSIHWGANWGYRIPEEQRSFAHRLIEDADVDVVHGHSSHHVKGIEVYRERLILYGCGDFSDDYEGIGSRPDYRDDLGLMYFASLEAGTGKLAALEMTPTRIRRMRVNYARDEDARWLHDTLNREGRMLGTRAEFGEDETLVLRWQSGA